ncbi:sperm-tail PG-rich repeat-containing protein 2 isoform X2 [Microcebus murinus]|uniref:sperm-tail PG-rich repeat-containing protein 2 isoform X2 n=1 Tax=Microcebus murinus TaxID=30608 RepID=UPI003F6BFCCD
MYDRAPRLLRLVEGDGTEAHVGPGSYQVPFEKQQATGSYAPFLSLTTREGAGAVASNIDKAVPGPGHYNISKAQQKISKAPIIARSLDIPSIPSCAKTCGYHIHEDDSITKCFLPVSDSTLGPAYYKPQFDASSATLKYKGIHFGNSSGRRELPKKPGPGPGQYDIDPKKTYCENINIKKDQQENCCSFLPRLYEVIVLQEKKKGVPGPGRYDIKSQFQKKECVAPNANYASPAFLSHSQRFLPIKSITPAPGTYHESRTAFMSLNKISGPKNIPFGQSTARFTEDFRTMEMPGPAFYNVLNNTIIANVRNICLKKKMKGAFGSSLPRSFFLVQKEAWTHPGPADYQVDRMSDELPNLTNTYAVFLSRVERTFKVPDLITPAPGYYDIQKAYDISQVAHKYMPPRSLVAKRRHSSFLSAAPRYVGGMPDGPGPASYDPVLRKSCPMPVFVKASKRFECSKEITPGPATYELSPFLRHSVLKRTYNVTLPNSILIKRENTPTIEQKFKQKRPGGKIESSK